MEKQELIIYSTEDGKTKISVRLQDENIWLTQAQMAQLFNTTVANINIHIKNIFKENELTENATIKDYLIVQKEGTREVIRKIAYYSLEMIIAVGYREKSCIGIQFRRWATEILSEYARSGNSIYKGRQRKAFHGADKLDRAKTQKGRCDCGKKLSR